MKKIVLTIVIVLGSIYLYAQPSPPPPPSNHGASGNQPGGGAPIDGGLGMFLVLGVVYGVKKCYCMKFNNTNSKKI